MLIFPAAAAATAVAAAAAAAPTTAAAPCELCPGPAFILGRAPGAVMVVTAAAMAIAHTAAPAASRVGGRQGQCSWCRRRATTRPRQRRLGRSSQSAAISGSAGPDITPATSSPVTSSPSEGRRCCRRWRLYQGRCRRRRRCSDRAT
ncbi:unnamed protein product, partial [Phaeothamnion confervicola]